MIPTVRVQITVSVDQHGNWEADGSSRYGTGREPAELIHEGGSLFTVEAWLPIPQAVTVQGTATPEQAERCTAKPVS